MFRINSMQLIGKEKHDGVCLSWQPDGILFEMSSQRVSPLLVVFKNIHSNISLRNITPLIFHFWSTGTIG